MKENNKMTVPSEEADHPGHLPSLIRVFAVHSMVAEGMRLIRVFAERTCHFVGFVMRLLNYTKYCKKVLDKQGSG